MWETEESDNSDFLVCSLCDRMAIFIQRWGPQEENLILSEKS